jgi:oligosaccharide repeat unit polymerase
LIIARKAIGNRETALAPKLGGNGEARERRILVGVILTLSAVSLAAVLQHWHVLLNKFGSVAQILLNGSLVYSLRVSEELPGMVPYLASFALAAVYVAGIYSARAGKLKLLALLPLTIVVLEDVALMGRANMVNGGILFLSAYSLGRFPAGQRRASQPTGRFMRFMTAGLVLAFFLLAAEFVRSSRSAVEKFYGASTQLSKLERSAFVTPSIYLYLSSHPGTFNAYWKTGGEHLFPGSNTFAPVFRVLSRFGLADRAPDYTKFYRIPIPSNTGTYLRELHADFGIAGILAAPFVLAFICTLLWLKTKHQRRLVNIAWLAHLYVVVCFSYVTQITRAGGWVISLITCLLISAFVDRQSRANIATEKHATN